MFKSRQTTPLGHCHLEPVKDPVRDLGSMSKQASTFPFSRWQRHLAGERRLAVLLGLRGPDLAVARELVKAALPGFCAPRQLVLVEALPRTNLGKVRRSALSTVREVGPRQHHG